MLYYNDYINYKLVGQKIWKRIWKNLEKIWNILF